jgi:chromosome segregation ATPase
MGASPEVVNLLLVSFWKGMWHRDKSGQTPLDILETVREEELYDPEACRVIQESLERSQAAYKEYTQEWENKVAKLKQQHQDEVDKMKQQHRDELDAKQARIVELETISEKLQNDVEKHCSNEKQLEASLETKTSDIRLLLDEMGQRQATIKELTSTCNLRQQQLQDAHAKMAEQSDMINELSVMIDELQQDLSTIYKFQQENLLHDKLLQAKRDFEQYQKSQQALEGLLVGQAQGLELLLEQRGIPIPQNDMEGEGEEGEAISPPDPNVDEPVDDKVALSAAAAAASIALERSDSMHD